MTHLICSNKDVMLQFMEIILIIIEPLNQLTKLRYVFRNETNFFNLAVFPYRKSIYSQTNGMPHFMLYGRIKVYDPPVLDKLKIDEKAAAFPLA